MKQFIVTVKHDTGKKRIRTAAEDKEAAAKLIMAAECCPERAIISIREAAYRKLSHEEIAHKKQDKLEDQAWKNDLERLQSKGALLSDFQE